MSTQPAFERPSRRLTPIGEHAVDDLRFIRATMERAAGLTAIPGWGLVCIGATAVIAAALAMRTANDTAWLGTWLTESVLAIGLGTAAMAFKARASGPLFQTGSWRRFVLAFSLPLIAAAVLTVRLQGEATRHLLPGVWLLLYGVGIAAGGAFSVGAVRAMGGTFMVLGGIALFVPGVGRDLWMAAGFGVLHIGFGAWIARRHGG